MRVAIVNDVQMAVEGLSRVVLSDENNEIAWVAYNGKDAVKQCANDIPDIILMDLVMPVMNGIDATESIMRSSPCPIIIVTSSVGKNCSMVFDAMGKGALDAINTPSFSSTNNTNINKVLLRKISMIGVLSRQENKTYETSSNKKKQTYSDGEHLIVIGSSSGGPNALAYILRKMPSDLPAAIVIVQHVDEQFTPALAQWLNEQSTLPVKIAKELDRPVKGQILLACTNDHLVMREGGSLAYQKEPVNMPYRPSVDIFWKSVSKNWHANLTAVLLTGMGKDGAQGMLELKNKGYYTVAQDESSSAVYGMPKAAVELGAVVDVLSLDEIIEKLKSRVLDQQLTTYKEY